MNRAFLVFKILPFLILFYGCPLESYYAPGNLGKERIDDNLKGIWFQPDSNAFAYKVAISENDYYSYYVELLEVTPNYSISGTFSYDGWVTQINNKKLFYLKQRGTEKFYIYQYEFIGTKVISHDIKILNEDLEKVNSTNSLRQLIAKELNKKDVLTNKMIWIKNKK